MIKLKILSTGLIFMFFFSCSTSTKETASKSAVNKKKSESVPEDHPGRVIYMQFCLACHMENGEGVPGLYPPLVQTDYVLGEKKRLIETVLYGMEGPIEVKGQQYNNVMAKLDYLNDKQIAEVLSYIRSNFGNNAEAISPNDVQMVRSAGAN